jgi:hypothetical protein
MGFKPILIKPDSPLHALLKAMMEQAEKEPPTEVPAHLRPGHEVRFLALKDGKPFACCRRDPRELVMALDWPEGHYDLRAFCTCCETGSSESWPLGRMDTFGDGIGTIRLTKGGIWSTDMPLT